MKEGACLRGEARCGIPFPGAMWLPRVPGTCRMHLVFQGQARDIEGHLGLWFAPSGMLVLVLMKSLMSCPQRGALWRTMGLWPSVLLFCTRPKTRLAF